jgi:hypothetical protein
MGWFSRKPTQQKFVEAAITVASNLYLQTISGAEDERAGLQFGLDDSRYRYLIFCLSTAVTAALAYDEEKQVQSEALINGCVQFALWTAKEHAEEFFDNATSSKDSVRTATAYFQDLLKQWSQWPKLEMEGRNAEIIDLVCSMLRTTESDEPTGETDKQRLEPLALEIDCRLPAMRGAFVELAKR